MSHDSHASPAQQERRYLDVSIPAHFVLEGKSADGEWLDWGVFASEWFQRQPDGAYLCAGHGGSPVWLRCVREEGDVLVLVDGGGELHRWRLRATPSV